MIRILALLLILIQTSTLVGSAAEYGVRARAGIHKSYDSCGGSKKDLVLGLGLGRYDVDSNCGGGYEVPPEVYDRQMAYYNRYYGRPQPNSWQQMPINWCPEGYQPYAGELGMSNYAYVMPSAYNVHSNLYDGSSRYNPYGINYRPYWY